MGSRFSNYLPENSLAIGQNEAGVKIFWEDSARAGINSAAIVGEIISYHVNRYPKPPRYWSVAEDGWDREGFRYLSC